METNTTCITPDEETECIVEIILTCCLYRLPVS